MVKKHETFARIYSGQPRHLSGLVVVVEIDTSKGLHSFSIVGLADKSIEESKDRVGSALKHSGYQSPKKANTKTVVSLAPAKIRKSGSHFDVAIALGYCVASRKRKGFEAFKVPPAQEYSKSIFIGELSLNGEIKPVEGVLSTVIAAKEEGFEYFFIPVENCMEAHLVPGVTIYPLKSLSEVLGHVTGKINLKPFTASSAELNPSPRMGLLDISEVRGQEIAKRALLIAASGAHNITLIGPPGTGKTMLAKAFRGILPPLTKEECLQTTGIHSSFEIIDKPITSPPFRSPHHTASYASIIGGGHTIKPGEITLAHNGVLFLDELPEFERRVIESLRQPMEDRVVSISRSRDKAIFPCNFILVAAMNPCPCGFKGYIKLNCTCNQSELYRYHKKLSGPIVDRIDLWVNVDHLSHKKLSEPNQNTLTSKELLRQVSATRDIQKKRNSGKLNSQLSAKDVSFLVAEQSALDLLATASEKLQLSPRSYHRILKIARTICDLESKTNIDQVAILEALQYRKKETI